MKEQEIMLKSYRKEIEVLSLTMDVPYHDGEKRTWYPTYEEVLLKLFNNKRENKELLKIINYYDSNEITIHINLTDYVEDGYSTKEEAIEHLKTWFASGLDIKFDDIKEYYYKGYIYTIPEYNNNITTFENDKLVQNYIEWED